VVRRDKDSKRVEGRNSPFQGPLGSRQVGRRIHVGCGEEDMKEVAGSDGQRGTKEMAGAEWRPEKGRSGQVRTGNAVTDASCVL
jgi:hypothetical protein